MKFKAIRNRAAALAAALAVLGMPCGASAGSMKHWVCAVPDAAGNLIATTNNTEGWSFSSSIAGGMPQPNCASFTSLGLRMDATNVQPIGANSGRMWWMYRAPAGTEIAEAHLVLAGELWDGADDNAHLMINTFRDAPQYDGGHVLSSCERYYGCTFVNDWVHQPVNATTWWAAWGCGGGGTCGGGRRGYLIVSHGYMFLTDNNNPAPGSVSGTVLSAEPIRGQRTLAFAASDNGVGIADVEVKIGGVAVVPRQTLDTNGGRCVPRNGAYLYPQPCRTTVDGNVAIDTTKAPEGRQTLTATIWDAAGNAATVIDREITIDNLLPPRLANPLNVAGRPATSGDSSVGAKLTASNGAWLEAASFARQWQISDDGSTVWKPIPGAAGETLTPEPWMVDKFVRVAVTATNSEGSTTEFSAARRVEPSNSGSGGVVPKPAPTSADELVPDNGSGGDPATGQLVPSRKRKSARVDYGDSVRIEGRVLDGAGRPVVDAQVDVFELIGVKGAVRRKVASVKTDAKGGYSYKPATHSNRVVELQYSRQRDASVYQSTHALDLKVRAGVTLRAERKRIRSYGTVTLRGRVLASDLPKTGIKLQMRAIDGKRELKIGNPRTNAKGEFTWKWKFSELRHATVPFYVQILRTGDLPALTNKSRVVRIRVG